MRHPILRSGLCAALALAAGLAAPARAEFAPEQYRAAIARYQSALVAIKYVVTMNLFGQEQRQDGSGQGVLVADDGLILVPDRLVNFELPALQLGEVEPGASTSLRASEFRVLLHGEEEWRNARFVTRAPDLELAWLKLEAAPAGLQAVDFAQAAPIEVGRPFLTVSRAGGVRVKAATCVVLEAPSIMLRASDTNYILVTQGQVVIEGAETFINPREAAPEL